MKEHLIKLAMALGAVFLPIEKTLGAILSLILADLITGILAARKSGLPITSAGLRRTVSKILTFESALCLGYLAEHYISGSLPFTNIVGSFISLSEMTSIAENLNTLSGGSLLSSLIAKLGSSNEKTN